MRNPWAIALFWLFLFAVGVLGYWAKRNRWRPWVRFLYGPIGPRTDVARMKKAELLASALRFLTWGLIFLSIILGGGILAQLFADPRYPHGFFLAAFAVLALFSAMGFIGGLYMLLRWLLRSDSGLPGGVVSLDSVTFDTSQYRKHGEIRGQGAWFDLAESDCTWLNPEGDVVALFYRPTPPALPADAKSIAELREHIRAGSCDERTDLIEFDLVNLSEVTAIRAIFKMRREPRGVDYQGLLSIPFAGFAFDIAIQCNEQGTTGIREAVLMNKALQAGTIRIDPSGKLDGDWNPDDEGFDEMFPQHALTRLRRELARVANSLRLEEAVLKRERFRFPEAAAEVEPSMRGPGDAVAN